MDSLSIYEELKVLGSEKKPLKTAANQEKINTYYSIYTYLFLRIDFRVWNLIWTPNKTDNLIYIFVLMCVFKVTFFI